MLGVSNKQYLISIVYCPFFFIGFVMRQLICASVSTLEFTLTSFLTTSLAFELLMHQSFVTMAPTGLGNSGDLHFSLCKTRVYARHCGDIFMVKVLPNVLLKSWYVNVKLLWPLWAWSQKPRSSTAMRGRYWAKSMALKPRYPRPPTGAVVTKWLVHYSQTIRAACLCYVTSIHIL